MIVCVCVCVCVSGSQEERKVVHRDLAARNVLLEAVSRTIKISDFGLARQRLEDQDYYKGNLGSNDLPIYWLVTSMQW